MTLIIFVKLVIFLIYLLVKQSILIALSGNWWGFFLFHQLFSQESALDLLDILRIMLSNGHNLN